MMMKITALTVAILTITSPPSTNNIISSSSRAISLKFNFHCITGRTHSVTSAHSKLAPKKIGGSYLLKDGASFCYCAYVLRI